MALDGSKRLDSPGMWIHVYRNELTLATAGAASLAAAMGIGRFAFTPVMPMMQMEFGFALSEGSLIAASNYLGYLIGAVAAAHPSFGAFALFRSGLLMVVTTTAAMSLGETLYDWMAIRLLAGVGSAWVLVGATSLIVPRLREAGRSDLGGIAFAGVGLGIAVAGAVCHLLFIANGSSATSWLLLGGVGLLFSVHALRYVPNAEMVRTRDAQPCMPACQVRTSWWPVIIAYGLFGYGYILPATFLPAYAREIITDTTAFGLIWPLFGLATVLSTVGFGVLVRGAKTRHAWIAAQLIMAFGLLLIAVDRSPASLVACSVCVGGTFMVITMLGMREGEFMGGANAKQLMALMTSAFALGQLAGPMVVSGFIHWDLPTDHVILTAATGLIAGSAMIARSVTSGSNLGENPDEVR